MSIRTAASHRVLALTLAVVAAAVAGCGGSAHTTPKVKATHAAVPTPSPPPQFSDKYAEIHAGMTLDDVRSLMGSQGNPLSQSDNGAGTTSIVVQWQDPKSSKSIIVTFIDNLMSTKSAIGF